jgi:hypothetical protein
MSECLPKQGALDVSEGQVISWFTHSGISKASPLWLVSQQIFGCESPQEFLDPVWIISNPPVNQKGSGCVVTNYLP